MERMARSYTDWRQRGQYDRKIGDRKMGRRSWLSSDAMEGMEAKGECANVWRWEVSLVEPGGGLRPRVGGVEWARRECGQVKSRMGG